MAERALHANLGDSSDTHPSLAAQDQTFSVELRGWAAQSAAVQVLYAFVRECHKQSLQNNTTLARRRLCLPTSNPGKYCVFGVFAILWRNLIHGAGVRGNLPESASREDAAAGRTT